MMVLNGFIGRWSCGIWPCGYTSRRRMRTNRAQGIAFIPTKPAACLSTPWSLYNGYTADLRSKLWDHKMAAVDFKVS